MAKKTRAAYMISAVAEQYQIHPQTLRLYEREGLLKPSRSEGNTRLYTDDDLERLEIILKLTRDFGVNLAGVEIILNMREKMEAMQMQIEQFIRTLNEELAMRRADWKAPPLTLESGYWKLYVEHVLQADEGADLDFLVGKRGAFVPKDNH